MIVILLFAILVTLLGGGGVVIFAAVAWSVLAMLAKLLAFPLRLLDRFISKPVPVLPPTPAQLIVADCERRVEAFHARCDAALARMDARTDPPPPTTR